MFLNQGFKRVKSYEIKYFLKSTLALLCNLFNGNGEAIISSGLHLARNITSNLFLPNSAIIVGN